ncbi:hypothetical protein LEP1GSC061_2235 [Leptospira wolffii serovar Khorat str. Khorat-H2]|nr:hypothetical protein LEP1GSC061_2235 [Leptospira wolffii serovar Khorat str. Khorat-H2]
MNILKNLITRQNTSTPLFLGATIIGACLGRLIGFNGPASVPIFGISLSFICFTIGYLSIRKREHINHVEIYVKSFLSIILGIYTFLFFEMEDPERKDFENGKVVFLLSLIIGFAIIAISKKKENGSLRSACAKTMKENPFFFVFLPSFFIYTFSRLIFSFGDSVPAKLMPFSLWNEGNFDLNEFFILHAPIPAAEFRSDPTSLDAYTRLPNGDFLRHPYYIIWSDSKLYGSYPILPGLFNFASFLILKTVGISFPNPDFRGISPDTLFPLYYLEKFTASLIAAFSAYRIFLIFQKRISLRSAVLLTLIFSFASTQFSISSQTLWQHGFIVLASILVIQYLLDFKSYHVPYWFFFGFLLGTFPFIRPTALLIAGAYGIYFLFLIIPKLDKEIRLHVLALTSLGFIASISILAGANYQIYSDIQGGYPSFLQAYANKGGPNLFNGSLRENLPGMLWSPGFGLGVFSPIFIFCLLGVILAKQHFRTFLFGQLLIIIAYLLFYSRYTIWWAGGSYGPRFLSDLAPQFVLLLVPVISFSHKKILLRIILLLTFLISTWAHASYVFDPDIRINWRDCNKKPIEQKIWDWTHIPYTLHLRKYFTFFNGRLEIEPIYECNWGQPSIPISGRTSFRFGEPPLLSGTSVNIIPYDTVAYFSSGEYCIEIYGASSTPTTSKENFRVIVSQGKVETVNRSFLLPENKKDYLPTQIPLFISKTGKVKVSLRKEGSGSIDFAGIEIAAGPCR